jgi:L-gulono-1,4-lactone dehydrogenase
MPSKWRNWAGDQACQPSVIETPADAGEVADVVARAVDGGRRLRVSGSGHSFTGIALTDQVMVRLDRLNRILDVDRDARLAKVEAGIILGDLNEALWEHGLALENLGDIDRQTLAGSLSTATHGTGVNFQNISSQVSAMELIDGNGRLVELTEGGSGEDLRAARVGLGALGVVTTVTMRCVPAFTIDRIDEPQPLEEVLSGIDELASGSDHFEFYVFPHTEVALCRKSTRTDDPPKPKSRWKEYLGEVLIENRAMDLLARIGRRFPSRIPKLSKYAASTLGSSRKVDRSYRVYASKRLIRFTEMEYAIPRPDAAEAVRRVLDVIPHRGFDVSFPIEVRFVSPDAAYLSTAAERDTAYIAVHMYRGMEWMPYFQAVEEIMDDYEGRPHWGKRHFQTADRLRPRYPNWDRFQEVRKRLDPHGTFENDYTDRVLGPI